MRGGLENNGADEVLNTTFYFINATGPREPYSKVIIPSVGYSLDKRVYHIVLCRTFSAEGISYLHKKKNKC
jgi:hypothetical protein